MKVIVMIYILVYLYNSIRTRLEIGFSSDPANSITFSIRTCPSSNISVPRNGDITWPLTAAGGPQCLPGHQASWTVK